MSIYSGPSFMRVKEGAWPYTEVSLSLLFEVSGVSFSFRRRMVVSV